MIGRRTDVGVEPKGDAMHARIAERRGARERVYRRETTGALLFPQMKAIVQWELEEIALSRSGTLQDTEVSSVVLPFADSELPQESETADRHEKTFTHFS